ncbi:MAG: hypothetical protein PHE09_17450 [Oscillospiraceae bacterium]|nr:hypothetical protein [Oscillospiraceae bacterium]
MELTTQDYVKKAIMDLQEHVRDFMYYSDHIEDKNLSTCFKDFAETQAKQATKLQGFLN